MTFQLRRQPWQRSAIVQLLAVLLGVLPMYVLSFISGWEMLSGGGFSKPPGALNSLATALLTVLVFGAIILFLLYFLCGERLEDLQLKRGRLSTDVNLGISLGLLLVALQLGLGMIASNLGHSDIPEASRTIALSLASNNWLLVVWLGPVVWLQASVLEELGRTFMLSRLWQVWTNINGKWVVLGISSVLFGLAHIYQGEHGVISTTLVGLVLGWNYMRHGRLLPLIIAHGVYDTAIILMMVIAVKQGLLE